MKKKFIEKSMTRKNQKRNRLVTSPIAFISVIIILTGLFFYAINEARIYQANYLVLHFRNDVRVVKCSTILQIVPERNAKSAVNRHNLENCATSGNPDIISEMGALSFTSSIEIR
ncbi:MAG: hypothetical protein GY749_30285 [Desulfobacteraceae bacterium]|nr:hypothetical protein [Desulfobacteraceae bacterium]